MAAQTIDAYVRSHDDWRGEVLRELDALIRKAAPRATASIKWAQPVYEEYGPFAYVKAGTNHVTFGFWRGTDLTDPKRLLEGTGGKMRHVKIAGPKDVRKQQFTAWVKEAVRLNRARGDPTRGR